ncbi:MAG: hypothetical protein M5U12_35965 [Verrucomicrobia bacterium]|nr:hypothetical protein [Verrucomicrobiota bacterium]
MILRHLHCAPMQSHELLRAVYDTGNPKQIAADLGLSLSLIYKWAEPTTETGSGATNPLDRLEQLIRSTTDDRIVQWVCQRAGGFFIRNPKAVWPHPPDLIPATNQVVQEFADLLSVIASAAADNVVSPSRSQGHPRTVGRPEDRDGSLRPLLRRGQLHCLARSRLRAPQVRRLTSRPPCPSPFPPPP